MSTRLARSSTLRPPGIVPGSRIASGTCVPESYRLHFDRGSGFPWSLVTITSVLSSSPALSRVASRAPQMAVEVLDFDAVVEDFTPDIGVVRQGAGNPGVLQPLPCPPSTRRCRSAGAAPTCRARKRTACRRPCRQRTHRSWRHSPEGSAPAFVAIRGAGDPQISCRRLHAATPPCDPAPTSCPWPRARIRHPRAAG